MDRPKLYVSASPHVHSGTTVRRLTLDSALALVPVFFAAWFYFGWTALGVVLFCGVAALATEFLWQKTIGAPAQFRDGSSLLSGLLLGFTLTTGLPWWMPPLGAFVAVVVGKLLFGGLGNHPFSTVLVGWTLLQVSYRELMADTPIPDPRFFLDPSEYLGYSPLVTLREEGVEAVSYVPWSDFLLGNVPGCIGTVSVVAALLGGGYLLYRRVITWHIPLAFVLSAWIFGFIFWKIDPEVYANPTFHILSGWIMFGAFFLAPEMGTAPVTAPGMILYGTGCGIITMIIRTWGIYVEGVPFAILLMNAMTPLLDRIRPKAVGRTI